MLSTNLTQLVNGIISQEEQIGLMEQHEMNQAHVTGLMGYKRFHRYRSMDRERHSIKLQCFMVENYHIEPQISINYSTPTNGMSFIDSIKYMHDRSASHIDAIKSACKMAFDEGEDYLGSYLEMMVADQSRELDDYYRLWMDSKRDNVDLNYLSKELHKKYKCLEKKRHAFKSDKPYKY